MNMEIKNIGGIACYTLAPHIAVKTDGVDFSIETEELREDACMFLNANGELIARSELEGMDFLRFIQERYEAAKTWAALVAAAKGGEEQSENRQQPEEVATTTTTKAVRRTKRVKAKASDAEEKLNLIRQLFGGGSEPDEETQKIIDELQERVEKLEKQAPKKLEITVNSVPAGKVNGLKHEMFEPVLKRVANNINVFLTGPAGSGKSHMCKQIADALSVKFYFQNAVTNTWDITGFVDAGGNYHESEFYKAFTSGGVFLLDEMDASSPDVLTVLNAALSNRMFPFPNNAEPAKQHKDFHCICAGNTYGTGADMEYVGRNQLDAATLDRFDVVKMGYSSTIESSLIPEKLLRFAEAWREGCKENHVKHICSTRCLIDMATLHLAGIPAEEYLESRLIKNLNKTDLTSVTASVLKRLDVSSNEFVQAVRNVRERLTGRKEGC